jgi:hypothetical protein
VLYLASCLYLVTILIHSFNLSSFSSFYPHTDEIANTHTHTYYAAAEEAAVAEAAKSGGSGITIDNFITNHNGCIATCDDDDGNNICTYTTKVDLFASEFGYFYFDECEQGTTTTTTTTTTTRSSGGVSASSNTMPTIAMEVSENIIVYCYKTIVGFCDLIKQCHH